MRKIRITRPSPAQSRRLSFTYKDPGNRSRFCGPDGEELVRHLWWSGSDQDGSLRRHEEWWLEAPSEFIGDPDPGETTTRGGYTVAKTKTAKTKATKATKTDATRGKYLLFGHPVTGVIRYMGTVGHSKPTAVERLEQLVERGALNAMPAPATVGIQLSRGRTGGGKWPIPELTAEQREALAPPKVELDVVAAAAKASAKPKAAKPKAAKAAKPKAAKAAKPKAVKAEPAKVTKPKAEPKAAKPKAQVAAAAG